jgi:hypothetical protein
MRAIEQHAGGRTNVSPHLESDSGERGVVPTSWENTLTIRPIGRIIAGATTQLGDGTTTLRPTPTLVVR